MLDYKRDIKTLAQLIKTSSELFYNLNAVLIKQDNTFVPINYGEIYKLIKDLAYGLISIGLKPRMKVGLISENRYEWLVSDLAILSCGAIDVPRGSNASAQEISFILEHSEAEYCFVENLRVFEIERK